MKYCVSGRHQYSVLRKADEVRVRYEDRDKIIDFVEKIPDKTIILDLREVAVEFDKWKMYDEKFEGGFYIALHLLPFAKQLNEENIKWYWPYPITSFYELDEIMLLNPAQLVLGPPLSFDLEKVRNKVGWDIPIRMTCNCARPAHLIANAGLPCIKGQYIRPEDVKLYEKYVTSLEFDAVHDSLTKEETLLDVYKNKGEWMGNLSLLITHLNTNVDNRGILDEFGERRMNCGQRCLAGGSCTHCDIAIKFSDQLIKIHDRRRKQADIDNN